MSRVISICNKKGGVGKTTSAVNIGARLAQLGYKTLLIDLDSQGSLTVAYGIRLEEEDITIARLLEDVMLNSKPRVVPLTDEEYSKSFIELKENLTLIPANLDLSYVNEIMVSKNKREFFLEKVVKRIADIRSFDYTIIDCSSAIDTLTVNALAISDGVIIPIVPQFLEYRGFNEFYSHLMEIKEDVNPSLKIYGVFYTKYKKRQKLTQAIASILSKLQEEFDIPVFETRISQCVAAAEAPLDGKDIFDYAKKSKAAEEYAKLVDEILKKEE